MGWLEGDKSFLKGCMINLDIKLAQEVVMRGDINTGALLPSIMNLIGKNVIQQNKKTGEKWNPLQLIRIEITEEGVFAILHKDYDIRTNLIEFDIYEAK